jgi:glycerol-3-phosphate acyltransferase PlsX
MRIVLDAIGGDHAPQEPVKGAVQAARSYGCTMVLVGPQEQIAAELKRHNTKGLDLHIVDAPDIIGMDEHPAQAVRRKTNSSHIVGLRMVRDGKADGFVSAGHSGASMAGALMILGRLPGIERPALGTIIPSMKEPSPLLLDVGATTDCKPEYLLQFAQMGSVYAERMLGVENPCVGLLSNGEEAGKGDRRVQEAHMLLLQSGLNFAGNVEPKEVLVSHNYDVVVSDGFIGNLVLKMGEATVSLMSRKTKGAFKQNLVPRMLMGLAPAAALAALPGEGRWRALAAALLGSAGMAAAGLYPMVKLRQNMDYRTYGGVPLLGVKGVVVIAHGRSDAVAVRSAICRALETVQSRTVQMIAEAVSVPGAPRPPQAPQVPANVLHSAQ